MGPTFLSEHFDYIYADTAVQSFWSPSKENENPHRRWVEDTVTQRLL